MHDYLRAFSLLSGARPTGFGSPGRIPLSEIYAWCRWNGIDTYDEVLSFERVITLCDSHFLSLVTKKDGDSESSD